MRSFAALILLVYNSLAADLTVLNTNDSGPGSLRSAIEAANASQGDDRIVFGEQARVSIHLVTLLPEINGHLEILGPGAANLSLQRSEATSNLRFFTVPPGSSLTISNLSLQGGSYAEGGAILNSGTLRIANSILSRNQATYGAGGGGGAILNRGTLFLTNTLISSNYAATGGGGIMNHTGTVTAAQSTFAGNSAGSDGGGGIANQGGEVTLQGISLVRNHTFNAGGGAINNLGEMRITNSTVSGNISQGDDGGAGLFASSGSLYVSFCTVLHNFAANEGFGGGIHNKTPATTWLDNSIVAFNNSARGPDLYGRITSGDYNLIRSPDFSTLDGSLANTLLRQEPDLLPLSTNGILEVYYPANRSPALNRANPTNFPGTDQLLSMRPYASRPDIGAVEALIGPEITSFWIFEGLPVLAFPTSPGWTYHIETTGQIGHPWQTLFGPTNGTGNPIIFQDQTLSPTNRFYRIRAAR